MPLLYLVFFLFFGGWEVKSEQISKGLSREQVRRNCGNMGTQANFWREQGPPWETLDTVESMPGQRNAIMQWFAFRWLPTYRMNLSYFRKTFFISPSFVPMDAFEQVKNSGKSVKKFANADVVINSKLWQIVFVWWALYTTWFTEAWQCREKSYILTRRSLLLGFL